MFCTHCGAQMPDGAHFCTKCGQELAWAAEEVRQDPFPFDGPEASESDRIEDQPKQVHFTPEKKDTLRGRSAEKNASGMEPLTEELFFTDEDQIQTEKEKESPAPARPADFQERRPFDQRKKTIVGICVVIAVILCIFMFLVIS